MMRIMSRFFEPVQHRARRKASAQFQGCRCRLILLMLGAALACWQSATIGESADRRESLEPDGGSQPIFWRLPENDGINCCYIQLRLLGYDGGYDAFLRQASDVRNFQTMESLVMLAKQLGFNLALRKLTTSELMGMMGPVLVHMEQEGIGSGTFSLVQSGNEQSVGLIEGLSMRRIVLPRDHFQRVWTGYALVPQPTTDWRLLARRCGALLLIGYIVTFLLRDRKSAARLSSPGCL